MRGGIVLAAAVAVLYLAACQWLMTTWPASPWTALVVVGPMLATAAVVGWRRGGAARAAAVLAALAGIAIAVPAARDGAIAPQSIYLAQNVAILGALALVFGATLAKGRTPLIAALASRVHVRNGLTPAMAAYCRKLTVAWTACFAAMATVSLALHALAPFAVWATFANIGTPLVVAAFFVGEHVLRYRLHPEFERANLGDTVRAYRERAALRGKP